MRGARPRPAKEARPQPRSSCPRRLGSSPRGIPHLSPGVASFPIDRILAILFTAIQFEIVKKSTLEPATALAGNGRLFVGCVMHTSQSSPDAAVRSAKVLLVGTAFGTRKVIRNLLLSVGVTDVHDAAEG